MCECVCAASLVAVETDVGETISAARVAFVCGHWSVGVVGRGEGGCGGGGGPPRGKHCCLSLNFLLKKIKVPTPFLFSLSSNCLIFNS